MVGTAHEEVVAIRRSFCRNAGTQRATRTTAVINHQRLARSLGKLGSSQKTENKAR